MLLAVTQRQNELNQILSELSFVKNIDVVGTFAKSK